MSAGMFDCESASEWMEEKGPDGEIVLSSRVRLARNIENIPFPYLASDSQTQAVLDQVRDVFEQGTLDGFAFYEIKDIQKLERQALVEKHLASPHLVNEPRNSALLLAKDGKVSIMVNEEDHLRIQCLLPGLQLEQALEEAMHYDDLLERHLNFAYDESWGYLTTCPTNTGTGLRASVMVHLPALVMTKQVSRLFSAISQVGLAVRGMYGEGSEMVGNLVQISNQITLGQSETEIVRNLYSVTRQIIEQEQNARQHLLNEGREHLADRVNRSLGILKHARLMSSQEALQLLSDVRLGIDTGVIDEPLRGVLKKLMVLQSPACLQVSAGRQLNGMERALERARLIRKFLN